MNYQKNETVASGLVKPKTTAIFFDKLWLPYYSNVFIGDIPEKILLMDNGTENLSGENDFCSRLYWFGAVTNRNLHLPGKILSRFDDFNNCNTEAELEKILENIFEDIVIKFKEDKITGFRYEKFYNDLDPADRFRAWVNHFSDFFPEKPFGDELVPTQFLTSTFRNAALIKVSKLLMDTYGIDMVPIFIDKTAFEECLIDIDKKPFPYQRSLRTMEKINTSIYKNIHALEVCLKNIPYPVERSLTWKQVMTLREDSKSINSIRRLKNMLSTEMLRKSESEIKELLDEAIANYTFSLKKHGVMTLVSGIATILSVVQPTVDFFSGNKINIISSGATISSALINFTAKQIEDFITIKRQPIAFLHELYKIGK